MNIHTTTVPSQFTDLLALNPPRIGPDRHAHRVRFVPDEFLSQLEKNAAVPVSMGCTIDHDVCAICGNRARTRADYCDENTCRDPRTGEHFPGCRHGLMKIAADGRMQFVYNVEPTFFDLSYVGVPADRAGYGYRADYLPYSREKTASVTVESARVLELPPYMGWTHHYRAEMTDMLGKLAAYEQSKSPIIRYDQCFQDESLGRKLAGLLPPTRWAALGLLAREGILLSPENFCTAFSQCKTAELDPYTALLLRYRDDAILATVLAALDHDAYRKLAGLHCPAAWIRQFVYENSSPGMAALTGTIRAAQHAYKGVPKSAAVDQKNSDAYALYTAAALCRFPVDKKEWGIKLAVWQTFE